MNQNRIIANTIIEFVNSFLDEKHNINISKYENSYNLLVNELPRIIKEKTNLNDTSYSIKGSIGQGRRSEIPWLAIFNTDITKKATEGFYLVYLFKADFSGFYLSLNQGFMYFKNKNTSKALENIKKVSDNFKKICNVEKEMFADIDLLLQKKLARGYKAGHILGKYYNINSIPDDNILVNDLLLMTNIYENMINQIGGRNYYYEYIDSVVECGAGILFNDNDLENGVDDVLSQNLIFNDESDHTPKTKSNLVTIGGSLKYPRNPNIAARAITQSNYLCENDNKHKSFTRKTNGKSYTEAHHLIPLCYYDDFDYSLDHESNICSLCSDCHNCLHHGIDSEKEIILKKLFDARKDQLEKCGIKITYNKLKKYYGIT